MEHQELVEWMRRQMQRREWTLTDLAKRMNVQPSMVSRWMRFQQPSPESVERIADALGGDVDELLTMAGHRPRSVEDPDEVAHLVSLLRRSHLTPDRRYLLEGILREMQRSPESTS